MSLFSIDCHIAISISHIKVVYLHNAAGGTGTPWSFLPMFVLSLCVVFFFTFGVKQAGCEPRLVKEIPLIHNSLCGVIYTRDRFTVGIRQFGKILTAVLKMF